MTSLEPVSSSHTVADKIIVVCSDGAEIDVDLRLFPSGMLRRLSALSSTTKLVPQGRSESQFADNSRVNIPFTKEEFAKVHAQYAINIRDYLQMPEEKNEVKLIDIALIPCVEVWIISKLYADIGAYGCMRVSYGRKTFIIEINLPTTTVTKKGDAEYPVSIDFNFDFKISSGKTNNEIKISFGGKF